MLIPTVIKDYNDNKTLILERRKAKKLCRKYVKYSNIMRLHSHGYNEMCHIYYKVFMKHAYTPKRDPRNFVLLNYYSAKTRYENKLQ